MNELQLMEKHLVMNEVFGAPKKSSIAKVLKSISFWKDILFLIQDIYDMANEKIPHDKKEQIVLKNVEVIKYLLRKNNVSDLYVDMAAAGLQVAFKHVGIKLSKTVRL